MRFLFVLLLSAMAFAQGGAATGDLHVTVKDPQGNFVTNATVTVRDSAKGLERTATSDCAGRLQRSTAAAGHVLGHGRCARI